MNRRDFLRGILAAGVMPGLFAPVLADRFQWKKSEWLYVPEYHPNEFIYWSFVGSLDSFTAEDPEIIPFGKTGIRVRRYGQNAAGEFFRL